MSAAPTMTKTRLVRPPRSLADLDSKNEDISSATLLETCCVYLCAGELYMVGYRENDLDDVVDLDGLLQQTKPLTLESVVHPPRVIQSYILDCTTCPRLSGHDVCLLLTYEYSLLLCCRGASLAEFHFCEVFESYFSEQEVDGFARKEQELQAGNPPSPIVMHMHESTGMLVVVAQGRVLVLSLDLDFICEHVEYFASDEASEDRLRAAEMEAGELREESGRGDGAGSGAGSETRPFDIQKCVRGATLADSDSWMLLAPDPTTLSQLPALAAAPPMAQSHTERCAVWCWQTESETEGGDATHITACTLVCSGNGNWLEFLPLTRNSPTEAWALKRNKDPSASHIESRANASMRETRNQPRINDHTAWVTCVSSGEGMAVGCTGDALGGLVVWQAAEETGESMTKGWTVAAKIPTSTDAALARGGEGGGEGGLVTGISIDSEEDTLSTGYRKIFKINYSPNRAITAIVRVPERKHSFWIGDTSGALTYVTFVPSAATYQCVTKVNVLNPGSIPTAVSWLPAPPLDPAGASTGGSGADGRLRYMCLEAGMALEVNVQQTACIFNAGAGPSFAPSHRSVVEVCALLLELELLVTGGSSHNVHVWNLNTCELELTIVSPDLYVTCIGAYDGGYVQGGCARILLGHANGAIHDYLLQETEITLAGSHASSVEGGDLHSEADASNASEFKDSKSVMSGIRAGITSTAKARNMVTSVDILDTLINDDDEGGGGGKAKDNAGALLQLSQESTLVGKQVENSPRIKDGTTSHNARSGGGAGKVVYAGYTAKHMGTYAYCPLPVTSILFSSLGLYFSFCYALQNVVVHDWERNAVHLQLELDQVLVSVSTLQAYELEDVHSDSLLLVLHGVQGIKFLDALNRQFIEPLTLPSQGKAMQACALWSMQTQSQQDAELAPAGMRQVRGMFVEHGMNAYTVDDDKSFRGVYYDAVNNPRRYAEGDGDSLDNVVWGVGGLSETRAPWVPFWGLRRAVMLRMKGADVLKTVEYSISNDKCRFVLVATMKTSPHIRANRMLVVVSDGTCAVLHL